MAIWAGIASIIASALAITLWVNPSAAAAQRRSITIAGCVHPESAFLHAQGLGMTDATPGSQFVIVDAGGVAYSVNGTREADLRSRVGTRVEATGTLERLARDPAAAGDVPGLTPAGSPAHETADAATAARVDATGPGAPTLPRLNVRSFRALGGTCAALPVPPPRAEAPVRGTPTATTDPCERTAPPPRDGARLPPPANEPSHPSATPRTDAAPCR